MEEEAQFSHCESCKTIHVGKLPSPRDDKCRRCGGHLVSGLPSDER